MGTVSGAAAGASASIKTLGVTLTATGGQMDGHVQAWRMLQQELNKTVPAAQKAKSALDRLGAAANDNINRMQATPGNIAAQFQDIGVTAAGGMNPLLIALQQGTQLSAAMSGGLGNLKAAFAQMLNPTSLLTIGLVALAAAGLQAVEWTKLAQKALRGLADVMVDIAPYAAAAAAGLALIYAPTIIAGLVGLTKVMYGLGAAILSTVGIPALL